MNSDNFNPNILPVQYHSTAGCVLLDELSLDANVLLIYRVWDSAPEGAYILPKGHVEEGESLEDAARRESVEETGYQNLKIIKKLAEVEVAYEKNGFWNIKKIYWFLAVLENNEKANIELTETEKESANFTIQWKSLDEAVKLVNKSPLDADKPAINALEDAIKNL